MSPQVRVVIPARFAATRLPGKPLLDLGGKPLLQHTWSAAQATGLEVLVATDDPRVAEVATSFGARSVLTPGRLESGTDRVAFVARELRWGAADVVVNLQVDEPFFPTQHLSTVAGHLAAQPDLSIATLGCAVTSREELFSEHTVKLVHDAQQRALYFSRAPIPWIREGMNAEQLDLAHFTRHIGVYAYRVGALLRLAGLPPAPLELLERLEQLRALHHGLAIHVTRVPTAPPAGIDTPEDLRAARERVGQRCVAETKAPA